MNGPTTSVNRKSGNLTGRRGERVCTWDGNVPRGKRLNSDGIFGQKWAEAQLWFVNFHKVPKN